MSCLTLLGPAGAPTRLVCLPHAGASGDVYAAWSGDLAGALEVWGATPAGRRHRSGEPLNVDPGRLVDEVVAEVTTDSRPLVVFGHSMGALIGYELSLALSTQGRPPTALVVSGCPPPHVRTARASRDYSDDELAATLVDWGGTEQQLIEDADLRRLTSRCATAIAGTTRLPSTSHCRSWPAAVTRSRPRTRWRAGRHTPMTFGASPSSGAGTSS